MCLCICTNLSTHPIGSFGSNLPSTKPTTGGTTANSPASQQQQQQSKFGSWQHKETPQRFSSPTASPQHQPKPAATQQQQQQQQQRPAQSKPNYYAANFSSNPSNPSVIGGREERGTRSMFMTPGMLRCIFKRKKPTYLI